MTAKVTETIDRIPTLNTSLADIFDFDGKCLDPLAIEIIVESLNYALETSVRRLESVAKVNPNIQRNAVETVLPAVKTLKLLIANAPKCDVSALDSAEVRPVPPPRKPRAPRKETKKEPKAEAKVEAKPEAVTSAPEMMAASVTKLQELLKEPKKAGKVQATKIRSTNVAEAEEARIIGTMTPDGQAKMKRMKTDDIEAYEQVLEAMAGVGKAPPVKLIKGKPVLPKVEVGQIVNVTMSTPGGDVEKKFLLVGEKTAGMADQQPEEIGVAKLSESSAIAQAIMGKTAGESVFMDIEGQKVKASVNTVKEGKLLKVEAKPVEPGVIKLMGKEIKPGDFVVQIQEENGNWSDYSTVKDQEDAYEAEKVLKSGWTGGGDTIPSSAFRVRRGGAKPIIISGKEK
jgi:transcription elongation GreA/GreB family factor